MNKLFEIKTVYGPHFSKCFDLSIGIDPLLPPKKCPLNCIYCSIGETMVKTIKPKILVDPARVVRDLEYFVDKNGVVFKNIFTWGFGDPLLNYQLPVITENIRNYLNNIEFKGKFIVKTSGVLLNSSWVKPFFKYIDEVVVPFSLPHSFWNMFVEPVGEYRFSSIINSLKNTIREYGDKLSIELTIFRYRDFTNAEESVLSETLSTLHNLKPGRIYVRTINRPSRVVDAKPVRGDLFRKVVDKLIEEGFETILCKSVFQNKISIVDNTNCLFNHILRKPISTDEVMQIYGSNVLKILDKSFVSKINWDNKIYFRLKSVK